MQTKLLTDRGLCFYSSTLVAMHSLSATSDTQDRASLALLLVTDLGRLIKEVEADRQVINQASHRIRHLRLG